MPSNINEIRAFIAGIHLATTEGCEKMTQEEAYINIKAWKDEGVKLPKHLDAWLLAEIWNEYCEA